VLIRSTKKITTENYSSERYSTHLWHPRGVDELVSSISAPLPSLHLSYYRTSTLVRRIICILTAQCLALHFFFQFCFQLVCCDVRVCLRVPDPTQRNEPVPRVFVAYCKRSIKVGDNDAKKFWCTGLEIHSFILLALNPFTDTSDCSYVLFPWAAHKLI
jgi:hypothetical protein